ncbi:MULTISPECIES: hypothetical protein [Bacillus cereus group]|uniref:Uncharacterized protein n=1 Tax=Bacillus cereus TaxID=1396 RepID=A0AA44QCY7_BACCE|nr:MULTISPECIES: hypothetical protein [Bacillus cereus group]EEL50608.1 hypothetical protein bcere0022_20020 [Bacillus cereus Rock3-44]PFA22603.1 hypothetical protein CN373_08345 [Bacillus cereus]PFN00195.1 hypothetical protein COJ55_25590 [Bacillus cereus]PFO79927.1 hypothetical protein COJ77_20165 [Bacillus cereus]PFR24687.1 hypothetical protein COK19_17660 [Bacillus cereus]
MKKGLFIILSLGLIAILIYFFFFRNANINSISQKEIQQTDFLKDKQAVVYLSSTADQDMDGQGISYAIFIDKKGRASGYKMNGLELGGISVSGNKKEILLESKNKLRVIGENFKEFEMKYQHTGEQRGYLDKENLFVNIYNSGVNVDTGGYNSNVVYLNQQGIHTGNIPHYLMSSGMVEDAALVITADLDEKQYSLKKITFNNLKMEIEDVSSIELNKNKEYSSYSSVLSDSKYYYNVLVESDGANNDKIYLLRIDKTTLKQELILLSPKADPTASIPFTKNNSTHLYNNELYFINGLGEVTTFHTQTNLIKTKFKIDYHVTDGVRYNEQTYFKDDQLYVLRYDENKTNKYYLEIYSLKSGKKMKEIEVTGMNEIINSVRGGKKIYAYDFKMLSSTN